MDRLYDATLDKARAGGLLGKGGPFEGFTATTKGLELSTEEYAHDVRAVTIRSGKLVYRIDPSRLQPPLRMRTGAEPSDGTIDLASFGSDELGITAPLITVRENSRWYVSVADTLLEWLRRVQSLPAGDFQTPAGGDGTGGASPEEAVRELAKAAAQADVTRVLDLMSPDELGAVYHYRRAIVEYLTRTGVVDRLRGAGSLTVDDLRLEVRHKKADSARVVIRSASGTVSSGYAPSRWTFEETCVRFVADDGNRGGRCLREALPSKVTDLADAVPSLGLETVKVGKRWYVSPVRTIVGYVQPVIDTVRPDEVLKLVDAEQFAAPAGSLSGSPTSGHLDSSAYRVFTFSATASQLYVVCNGAATNAADIEVFAPSGQYAERVTSIVYRAETTGEHRVVVSAPRDSPATYELVANLVEQKSVNVPTHLTGTAGPECRTDVYRVSTGGRAVSIDSSTRVTVLDDLSHTQYGPLYDGGSGDLTVIVSGSTAYDVPVTAVPAGAAALGSAVEGRLTGGTGTTPLYVPAASTLTITLTSNVDTVLELLSPSGTVLATDDDSGGSNNPVITYSFGMSGTYRLRVRGYTATSGDYTIRVS
jgi:hypothetical protein